jgi:hypothetical protein
VTDQSETSTWQQPEPAAAPQGDGGSSPAEIVEQRPEVGAGAAFAGGFVLALILKRLAR